MTFDTLTFVLFLISVLAVVGITTSWRVKKRELLVASYLFYAAWNPVFVSLLIISTVVDWFAARGMARATVESARKRWLVASLTVNLGMLGYFKYADFLIDNLNRLGLWMGLGSRFEVPALDLILPIGISFYTFQTLSYTIDVYRRRVVPGRDFLDYALFVSFFPQLVAGPIVRYEQFIGQLKSPRRASSADFEIGAALIVFGLVLKSVLADSLFAPVVDAGFAAHAETGLIQAWTAVLGFSGQIYCDFAGYSLCAIGAARLFGFRLPKNFHAPYAAIGFSEFWQRWHISLSSWIRDYLYIPLGGNRSSTARTFRNLVLTMGLGGLWHGAAWTFVLWGLLHGIYLVVEHGLRRLLGTVDWLASRPMLLVYALLTFTAVSLAWVLFRAEQLAQAMDLYQAMFGLTGRGQLPSVAEAMVLIAIAFMLLWHGLLRQRELENIYAACAWPLRAIMLGLGLALVLMSPGEDRAFIYFQF